MDCVGSAGARSRGEVAWVGGSEEAGTAFDLWGGLRGEVVWVAGKNSRN